MSGPVSNVMVTAPTLFVLGGLVAPIVVLDGAATYLAFLWNNPGHVAMALAAWWVLGYWSTRWVASVFLLRSSGAKLRVSDARQ